MKTEPVEKKIKKKKNPEQETEPVKKKKKIELKTELVRKKRTEQPTQKKKSKWSKVTVGTVADPSCVFNYKNIIEL